VLAAELAAARAAGAAAEASGTAAAAAWTEERAALKEQVCEAAVAEAAHACKPYALCSLAACRCAHWGSAWQTARRRWQRRPKSVPAMRCAGIREDKGRALFSLPACLPVVQGESCSSRGRCDCCPAGRACHRDGCPRSAARGAALLLVQAGATSARLRSALVQAAQEACAAAEARGREAAEAQQRLQVKACLPITAWPAAWRVLLSRPQLPCRHTCMTWSRVRGHPCTRRSRRWGVHFGLLSLYAHLRASGCVWQEELRAATEKAAEAEARAAEAESRAKEHKVRGG
jgi:hypothetical protein